jgi:hypothetical protein
VAIAKAAARTAKNVLSMILRMRFLSRKCVAGPSFPVC